MSNPSRNSLWEDLKEGEKHTTCVLEAVARERKHHAREDALGEDFAVFGDEALNALLDFRGVDDAGGCV